MIFPISQLNAIFNSSKPTMGIISIWGDFGVGKTTLAVQCAITTAKSSNVLFIYTKPNFPFQKIGKVIENDIIDVLNNISFVLTPDFIDLYRIVFNLEFLILNYLKELETTLNLIIIDSITDLYRLELNREKKEKNVNLNYQLNQIMAVLSYINKKYATDVLIVNESSRKNTNDNLKEIQSGGKVMDYWVNCSLKIMRTKKLNVRNLILTKHPEMKNLHYSSDLTEKGFK